MGWTPFIIAVLLISIETLYYNRIGKIINRHQLWFDIKSVQLARMTLDWEHIPEPPLKNLNQHHPFEIDLDITGQRSLHHLLDMTISYEGSQRLRDWLLQIRPDLQSIEKRQRIVRELVPLSRFRDKLLLNFRLVSKEQLDGQKLLNWLQAQPPSKALRWAFPLSFGLALTNIILFVSFYAGWLPGYWILSLVLYLAVYFVFLPAIKRHFDAVMLLYDELDKFKVILRDLETYPYRNTPYLRQLCEPFWNREHLPSKQLRKITWLTMAVGLRMNPILSLFLNIAFPWDILFAYLGGRYQRHCSEYFPKWVHTWSELEALVSLANFAYLHPEYMFPEICPEDEGAHQPIFQAIELGHPLIPSDQKVHNDFLLYKVGEITLITGSNMSGKSTFLKTAGVNLCLAYAGGPVDAKALRTRLFRIFTCMQIHDSITDGLSFFYAEVKRLKALLAVLHDDDQAPVFFLIDEIFKGTNSRERLIGGRAYIHHLSKQSGVGMIATHDLELGQLEDQIPSLTNYHFRDNVTDGRMVFDYKLHPGLCTTTNALKIMRMEGLPVETTP